MKGQQRAEKGTGTHRPHPNDPTKTLIRWKIPGQTKPGSATVPTSDYRRILNEKIVEANKNAGKVGVCWTFERYVNDPEKGWRKLWQSKPPKIAQSSFEKIESMLDNVFLPEFGNKLLSDIKRPDVEVLYNKLRVKGPNGRKGLAEATLLRMHIHLSKIFQDAMSDEVLVGANPCARIKLVANEFKAGLWNFDQFNKAYATAKNPTKWARERYHIKGVKREYWGPIHIAALLGFNGMRRGELAGARWDDLTDNVLEVFQTLKVNKLNGREIKPGAKTRTSLRKITLGPVTMKRLKQHKAEQSERMLALGAVYDREANLICAMADGTPMKIDQLPGHWNRICKWAGVEKIRFHDLRHSHSQILTTLKVGDATISRRLGHEVSGNGNAEMFGRYTQFNPELDSEAAALFDAGLDEAA